MEFLRRLFGGNSEASGASARPADIDARELQARLTQAEKPFVLDVRETHEYADAHIAGSVLIPLGALQARVSELPRNRDIVCVCRSGNRSGVAARMLATYGFTVVNLSGGMIGWTRAGLPVKRGRDNSGAR
ncbi:MAG: rhodanese-like domain-containing protein [Anaerolineae bacterium]